MSDLYSIGVGYDVPLLSLTRITSIVVPGTQRFGDPKATPKWDDGEPKIVLDGMVDPVGFQSIVWEFGFVLFPQYSYLRTTYCAGGLSGRVTIYTNVSGSATYQRLNAIMILKSPAAYQSEYWYKPVELTFTRLEAAA